MSRSTNCKFAIYFNKMNKHVTIHKIDCPHVEKHGGEHEKEQGGYGYFVKEYEVIVFANSLGDFVKLPPATQCSFCHGTD